MSESQQWWYIFHEDVAATQQPGLDFYYFKPPCESSIFRCISWTNDSLFEGGGGGVIIELYVRKSQDLSNTTNVASLLPNSFLSWHP